MQTVGDFGSVVALGSMILASMLLAAMIEKIDPKDRTRYIALTLFLVNCFFGASAFVFPKLFGWLGIFRYEHKERGSFFFLCVALIALAVYFFRRARSAQHKSANHSTEPASPGRGGSS